MPVVPLASKRTSEAGLWDESKECTNCSKVFTLLNRRHHCRVCGHVFCAGCSAYRVRLASSRTGKEKRACATCFAVSGAGGGYEPLAPPTRPPSKSIVVGSADLALGQGRRTAADLGGESMSAELALAELRKPLGAYNWALFHPTATLQALRLHNAGSLSVNGAWRAGPAGGTLFARLTHSLHPHTACLPAECVKYLKPGETLYGLLRLGFGQGRFRRTKSVFFSWVPSGLPTLAVSQRKRMAETRGNMAEKLGAFHLELQVTALEELTLPVLLDKAKKIVMLGEAVVQEEELSEEAFYTALTEECTASQDFFGGALADGPGGAGAGAQ